MRTGRRLATTALVAVTSACVTVALAQPRRGAKPRPKPAPPPAAVVDAGPSEGAAAETIGASSSTTASAPTPTADGGAAAPPSPARPADVGDGGARPSPLNPAPNELPPTQPAPPPGLGDYDKLIGDVSALRARVAAVTDTLFKSRIAIALQADGDHAKIARLTVSLDDGVVYTAPPGFRGDDAASVYEHGVAPGRHAVTVDVERRDDRDDTFRTAQRSRFVVDVPKDERLDVQLRVSDDSSMGGDFPGDHSGKYDLRVRMKAASRPVGR